jgi:hypothetical protein
MKNFNGRLFFSVFFIARANQEIRILALGRGNYSTKKPLFLSAVLTPYLNNAVHTPHVLYSRCYKSIVLL